MDKKLYWPGNAAKTKIIKEILERAPVDRLTLIFDYGCGKGGDWPAILRDHPHIKLIGYEPYLKSYEIAKKCLHGLNAELFTGNDLEKLDFKADFIVSFSVLEHVYDRRSYLQTAKRLLAENGLFFLNYDDGHFRNLLDLNRPNIWFGQVKEWLHNLIAGPLSGLGIVNRFQKRVYRQELEALLLETGFRVLKSEYSNVASFKQLQKTMPPELQQEFSEFWLAVEEELNRKFNLEQNVDQGDTANLWRQMGSKTLYLELDKEA